MATIWKILTRKKVIDPVREEETSLARVLNTFDLTALGVGSTLGVGVYVLAGHVAKDTAGPAVLLSFLIAAIASAFAGLCYAELGARAPRAGSAYIYSYVCVGEFVAFVIGWNLILEYVIGSASVARGLSSYLDSLINNSMQNAFIEIAPINVPFLSEYFDFFSFVVTVVLAVALAFGLKESSLANNIFTVLNIFVCVFVVIAGSIKSDTSNWAVPGNSSDPAIGDGGFLPFGIEGVIKGAATCFYGFVGFDCIATTGEEVKNPKKAIPISIVLSLLIIFLAYFGTSTVITLMVPYYRQNPNAPIPFAFEDVGWIWAKWIVSIGGIFGLCASLFGAMFPLPRIIYAMANDGVIFKFLGKVHPRFQTPVIGTLVAGVFTGLMAAMFELKQLVDMMSIGTLLAYTIVAASVMLLRYSEDRMTEGGETNEDSNLINDEASGGILGQIFNCGRFSHPTKTSENIVAVEICLYCITCILLGLCAIYLRDEIGAGKIWAIVLTALTVFVAVILIMSLVTQPTSKKELSFKVPMVPLIPALSILINIYLMLMLDTQTWIRFAVWMIIGFLLYIVCLRMYACAENRTLSLKSIDTQKKSNGMIKGHVYSNDNKGFENDLDIKLNGTQKMKDVTPSSDTDNIENILLEKELQKLDKMLDEEGRKLSTFSDNRKLSIDTVSVASSFVMHEESVVAVVHRDNVHIPADSNSPFLYSHHPYVVKLVDTNDENISDNKLLESNNESTNSLDKQLDSDLDAILSEVDYNSSKQNLRSEGSVDSGIHNPESYDSKEWEERENLTDSTICNSEISELNSKVGVDPVTDIITESSNLNTTECYHNKEEITESLEESTTESGMIENLVTLQNAVDQSSITETNIRPPPPPPPPPVLLTTETLPVRPTSENLSNVTLRPVQPKLTKDNSSNFQPDDDNLTVNSEKTKKFKDALSDKLRNSFVYVPIIYTNKPAITSPVKSEEPPNENVIEDKINVKDAKEKLSGFLNSLLKTSPIDTIEAEHHEEKDTDNNENKIHTVSKDIGLEDQLHHNTDEDCNEHKRRMLTVFRSMTLKNSESEVMSDRSRNVNTVGPVNDDRTRHRQAMSDIFKTIKLRRKESTNLAD